MERSRQDQSCQTLISDEDATGLIQSDNGKTPEFGLSVCPRFRSSTVPGIGQTSSNSNGLNLERPRPVQDAAAGRSSKTKKLKATTSMATWLRIGSWEKKEIYVGDVVGRCYYCSKKLAWEVTEGGWRSKIEFGWSKIIGMQAIVNDDHSVTLNLEFKEPPIFYVEEQVFKSKMQSTWLKSADFTEACQASTFRRHSIRFKAGVFDEVYANLLSSDTRLLALTQKPFPTLNSPFFDDSPIELLNGNPFSAAAHSLPFLPVSSPSLHPSNLTQLPPQINQQLQFSSPSSSQLAPLLLQPNQHFPISWSFPTNPNPLPPQPIPSLHQWPIDDALIESSYRRNEFGSSTNLAPLLQPLRMSLSNPDDLAPLPLQINQEHLMNQHLHQSTDPRFHQISENVLPKQTVGSSNSTTVFAGGMMDIDWLLGGEEDATNGVSSSDNVLSKQTVGSSSSMAVFAGGMTDIDWFLGGEEDATNGLSSSENVLPKQTVGSSSSMTVFPGGMMDIGKQTVGSSTSTTGFPGGMMDIDWLLGGEEDAMNVVSSSGTLSDVVAPVINNIARTTSHSSNNF